jgi:hypothetical protein
VEAGARDGVRGEKQRWAEWWSWWGERWRAGAR